MDTYETVITTKKGVKMATGYKEPNTYKGFEQWWHSTQMSAKMYIYCFIALMILHLMIPVLYFILFEPQIIGLFLSAVFSFQFQYLPKFFRYFLRAGWFIFVIALQCGCCILCC
jgi:hypothetical protein